MVRQPNLLGQRFCPYLGPCVALGPSGIELALDPDDQSLESANLDIRQVRHRMLVHGADQRSHGRSQAPPARRQMNDAPPAIGVRLGHRHQAFALQQTNRDYGRWTLTTDAPSELAGRQSVFFPQLAQITPLADCDAVGHRRYIHSVLPSLGELTDVIPRAARQRDEVVVCGRGNRLCDSTEVFHRKSNN